MNVYDDPIRFGNLPNFTLNFAHKINQLFRYAGVVDIMIAMKAKLVDQKINPRIVPHPKHIHNSYRRQHIPEHNPKHTYPISLQIIHKLTLQTYPIRKTYLTVHITSKNLLRYGIRGIWDNDWGKIGEIYSCCYCLIIYVCAWVIVYCLE